MGIERGGVRLHRQSSHPSGAGDPMWHTGDQGSARACFTHPISVGVCLMKTVSLADLAKQTFPRREEVRGSLARSTCGGQRIIGEGS